MDKEKDFDIYVKITIWRRNGKIRNYYYDKIRSKGIDEEDALKNANIKSTILKICRV